MRLLSRKIHKKTAGTVMVEFALAGPVLLLLAMGAIDFGKAFYYSITVSNAANTGALVGSENMVESSHYSAMQDAATQATLTVETGAAEGSPAAGGHVMFPRNIVDVFPIGVKH